jgi:ParB family transcriptional regulator, chromosome partitioning protein
VAEPAPRRGLGRGLSALLGDPVAAGGLVELELEAISPNPRQPRTRLDEAALSALAESIQVSGLVQPVVVRPAGDGRYELIAGERRWRAARMAGLERMPALVREAEDRERLELALVENLVREDLNAIEVARAVATLVEDFGQTHEEVGTRLGRSRPAISNLLRLLELPDAVQDLVIEGLLAEGHARAVLMADGARARRRLAERAVEEGLSVRQVEAIARRARRAARPPDAEQAPILDAAVEAFTAAFEVPVRARATGKGVAVELRFASEEALAVAITLLGASGPGSKP